MTDYAITIKTDEEKHVLNEITKMLSNHDVNITYTHLLVNSNDTATVNLEVADVEDIDKLIDDINNPKNNIKMTKGLTKIASDLRRIADELESYTTEKEPKCVEGVIE